jgi:hypothetical protein
VGILPYGQVNNQRQEENDYAFHDVSLWYQQAEEPSGFKYLILDKGLLIMYTYPKLNIETKAENETSRLQAGLKRAG